MQRGHVLNADVEYECNVFVNSIKSPVNTDSTCGFVFYEVEVRTCT